MPTKRKTWKSSGIPVNQGHASWSSTVSGGSSVGNATTSAYTTHQHIPAAQQNIPTNGQKGVDMEKNKLLVQDRFREAQIKHIEAAKKHTANYDSSSDEDDQIENNNILDSVFKNYTDDKIKLQKTQEFLENVFQSGAATCLICIATVKRSESIWSCDNCYSFFHLACIQRWANDSIAQKQMHHDNNNQGYYTNQGVYVEKPKLTIKWDCPKCRTDYLPIDIPRHYTCFCKNELNPPNHPWLIPHSCGEMCRKPLIPDCGHKCVLLCHPGPCPPCPQMIITSCKCQQSDPRMIRCSQKHWNCLMKCKQKLKCMIHICNLPCHNRMDCPPCSKKSKQQCLCGAEIMERNCSEQLWQCNKICNKNLNCGLHKCKEKCHSGECYECPLGLPRSCPCGKQKTQAPCSEDIGPCGDTCQKTLPCGIHMCAERCHNGDCGQCLEKIQKSCRCGQQTKELACSKVFLCSLKCKKMRDCKKHPCNTKCCDGDCPPCNKICGKTLSCGKHKCISCCHLGPCYPCTLKAPVKCSCKGTVINVLCGREKKVKPPKCNLPCKIPSKCHHENPHRCHLEDCPPCHKLCLLKNDVTNCEHPCVEKCHDAVKITITDNNFKPAGPWERQPERFEIRKLDHPPCETKVPVTCIGGHEEVLTPCWNSVPQSCGRQCGRKLKCTNHLCEKQCHTVLDLKSDKQDINCTGCNEGCIFKRPDGCIHKCTKQCHPLPCEICTVNLKTPCHCGLTNVFYKCGEFYPYDSNSSNLDIRAFREKALSCQMRCIKNYQCGHRCINNCHSGPCTNPELCKKKVKVYCECKTRKIDITCDRIRSGFQLNCDNLCMVKKEELRLVAEELARKQKELEDEKNRQEIEEFEKKFGKKKYKERKKIHVEQHKNEYFTHFIIAILTIVIILIAICIYYFMYN